MDAANLLKPALARGELRCIGATTLDEYRKRIEKDAALERRFQPVLVSAAHGRGHDRHPARPEGALRGPPRHPHPGRRARGRGDALEPLHHRALPARQGHRPRRRGRGEDQDGGRQHAGRDRPGGAQADAAADRGAGAQAASATAARRRASRCCEREIAELEESASGMRAQWLREKEIIDEIRKVQPRARGARAHEEELAQRAGDLGQGRGDQVRQDPRAREEARRSSRKTLAKVQQRTSLPARGGHRPGHRRRSSPSGPASPSSKMLAGRDGEAPAHGGARCARGSSGRKRRSSRSSNAVRRSRAGLGDERRPIGSFLFLGPDGRRQDRARARPGRVPVRRRAGDDPAST